MEEEKSPSYTDESLVIERLKVEGELKIREAELKLKEAELSLKKEELKSKRLTSSPAIILGLLTAIVTIIGYYAQGYTSLLIERERLQHEISLSEKQFEFDSELSQQQYNSNYELEKLRLDKDIDLAERKFFSDSSLAEQQYESDFELAKNQAQTQLILNAVSTGEKESAIANLQFFVDAGLINDSENKIATLIISETVPVLPRPENTISLPEIGSLNYFQGKPDVKVIGIGDTGSLDAEEILSFYQYKTGITPHYLIGLDGEVFPLIPEDLHATAFDVSEWDGLEYLDNYGISIHLLHTGSVSYAESLGLSEEDPGVGENYPDEQIASLISLVADIACRYSVDVENIVTMEQVTRWEKTGLTSQIERIREQVYRHENLSKCN